MNNNNKCCICNSDITPERIEGLDFLGILPSNRTCISCANNTTKLYKGVYLGNSGVSPLVLANNIGEYGIKKEKELYSEAPENIEEDSVDEII